MRIKTTVKAGSGKKSDVVLVVGSKVKDVVKD
jgi:hypothetical protein